MRKHFWRWGVFLPLLAAVVLVSGGLQLIGEPSQKEGQRPVELQRISADAGGFVSLRVADLWDSDLVRSARDKMKDLDELEGRFKEALGVPLGDIDRLGLVMLHPITEEGEEPLLLVVARRPVERSRVLTPLGQITEEKVGAYKLLVGDADRAACWLDERTFALGRTATVKDFLKGEPKHDGPLADALQQAARKHTLVVGINGSKLDRLLQRELPPDARPLEFLMRPLFQARAGLLIVDMDKQAEVRMEATFANEADARAAVKAAGGLEMILLGAIRQGLQEAPRQESLAAIAPQLRKVCTALEQAPIEQKGNTLRTTARVPIDPKLSVALVQAPARMRVAAQRIQSMNNLKQIALAMINYADTNGGTLAPQAIYGKDGKPLLSWRVLILPYIEQQNLYMQFHLDEPWDSEHNKKLLDKMPVVYASPADPEGTRKHQTHYLGFAGKGAFFDGKKGLRFPASITDGTSNTIMVVEGSKSVPWTKPEDIPFDIDKDVPDIGSLFPNGFLAAMCDGSVRLVSKKVSRETLKAAITANNGDILGSDW
jgi:hypothetical protein